MMTALVEYIDDRFAGIDIDSLLNGERQPLSYERKKALYEAPEFIQRLSGEETVMEGQSLCIECKIRGFPVPYVRWFKDDEEILDNDRIHVESNGIGGYFLFMDNVTRWDEAAYRCRAENVEGACSSFFFLSVKVKPKGTKKRDPANCPSWRSVSYPPMFSTIVEKVEEEEEQGIEFEKLPPSPLTEFYYALTLKSRCVWPTFLGDWAFVNNDHSYRRLSDDYNSTDDNDDDMNQIDEEEDENINENIFIPNGYICDKLKPLTSNKAHLEAKRRSRRGDGPSRAQEKKRKFNNKEMKKSDERKDVNSQDKNYSNNLADKDVIRTKEKSNETHKKEGKEVVKKISQDIEDKQEEGKQNDQNNVQKYIWNAVERANEEQERRKKLKEEKKRQEEEMKNEENLKRKKEEERKLKEQEINKKNLEEKNKQDLPKICDNERTRRWEMELEAETRAKKKEEIVKNKAEEDENNFRRNTNLLSNKISILESETQKINTITSDKSLLSKTDKHDQESKDFKLDSKTDKNDDQSPLPGTIRIFTSNSTEETTSKETNLKPADTQNSREKSPTSYKDLNRQSTRCDIASYNSDSQTYASRLADDYSSRYQFQTIQRTTINEDSNSSLLRPRWTRDSRSPKQEKDENRLEELRQKDNKRLEELKQQELKRMEELRQEGNSSYGSLRRRDQHREDLRTRERKQLEELRRRELKQREELRMKEEKQIEEMKKERFTEALTTQELQQRQESLIQQRVQLRLDELTQKEGLKMRELQHRGELYAMKQLQTDELIAQGKRQIDELRVKEETVIREISQNRQTEPRDFELEFEERKQKEKEVQRINRKKEQLRKEQLQRQFKEEQNRRQGKNMDVKRWKDHLLGVKTESFKDKISKNETVVGSFRQDSENKTESNYPRGKEFNFQDAKIQVRRFTTKSSTTTFFSVLPSTKEKESEIKKVTTSTEKNDLSNTKPKVTAHTLQEPSISFIDRPQTVNSGPADSQKKEENILPSSSAKEKHQDYSEKLNERDLKRKTQKLQKDAETPPILSKSRSPVADNSIYTGSSSLTQTKPSTQWTVPTFFDIEETKDMKPVLHSHEDMIKLANSIAERRERFHEFLSQSSLADNDLSEKVRPTSDSFGREADSGRWEDRPSRRDYKLLDDTEVSRYNLYSYEPKRWETQTYADPLRGRDSSWTYRNVDRHEIEGNDSFSISRRPYLHDSSKTVTRRYYTQD